MTARVVQRRREAAAAEGRATLHEFIDAGVSYAQLHLWTKRGYLRAAESAGGPGSQTLWPREEVAVAAAMVRYVKAGLRPAAAMRAARYDGSIGHGVFVTIRD